MRALVLAVPLLFAAACGGSAQEVVRTVTVTVESGGWTQGDCNPAGKFNRVLYRVCAGREHGVDRLDGGSFERVSIQDPGGHGAWHWGAVSPDGRTLLLQWHGECEVPIAFVVSTRGGTPTPVTGEQDWKDAAESIALGWTTEGKPIVRLPRGVCGRGSERPGTFVVENGDLRRLEEKVEPSLLARDL